VTTVADAGSSGWRTFADFKDRIVDQSKTRVLAFIKSSARVWVPADRGRTWPIWK